MKKLLFLVGILLFLYPSISDWWNSFHQSQIISSYEENVSQMDSEECERIWQQAQEYNEKLAGRSSFASLTEQEEKDYKLMLSMYDDGMMGYIEIPSIECRLPVYHGTEEAVLQKGAGHMNCSSLPIGGTDSHCVISGHRGLPSARLFTGLDRVKKGDVFLIRILDRSIYYEVKSIQVVLPEETNLLKIEKDMDLCTLVTCTPYGINSHRLLVQGSRINEIYEKQNETEEAELEGVMRMRVMNFMKWSVLCLLIVLFCVMPTIQAKAMEQDNNTVIWKKEKGQTEEGFYHIWIQYPFSNIKFRLYQEGMTEDENDMLWKENEKPIQTVTTNEKGQACFENVKSGRYYIVGDSSEKEGYLYQPAVSEIELPALENGAVRRITISPKYERVPIEEEEEEPETEQEELDSSLPQTGQSWIPVSVMVFAGVVLLISAWIVRKT